MHLVRMIYKHVVSGARDGRPFSFNLFWPAGGRLSSCQAKVGGHIAHMCEGVNFGNYMKCSLVSLFVCLFAIAGTLTDVVSILADPWLRNVGGKYDLFTPWKFNSSPLKMYHPKREVVFQPSFFRGYVKLPGCNG